MTEEQQLISPQVKKYSRFGVEKLYLNTKTFDIGFRFGSSVDGKPLLLLFLYIEFLIQCQHCFIYFDSLSR